MQRSAREAWGMALRALQPMLAREVYAQAVEPLRLSRFEPLSCCFEATVWDAEQAAWLEQRLKRTLERALTGACGREARVSFSVQTP
jgi:hypothetical protein